jgi:hypothetical protein
MLKPPILSRAVLYLFVSLSLMIVSQHTAYASAEWVYVGKVFSNDDKGIIVRSNGEAYQIEKGVGCLSFWRYEGKRVLISSPGLFLGVGSELILPDAGQKCRIWDSESLGQWTTPSPKSPQIKDNASSLSKKEMLICQIALSALGYYSGEPDGIFGEKTKIAILSFQKKVGLKQTGSLNADTAISLSKNVHEKYPDDPKALNLAMALLNIGKHISGIGAGMPSGSYGCDSGHWISSVSNGGEIIILEDGSVWQVDSVDTIDTSLWLPIEDITVCNDSTMINTNNGEKVGVARLK